MIELSKKSKNSISDNTCNHQCSRCGECCGLLIPFTEKELSVIKEYVKEHDIKPYNRVNPVTGAFNALCCFYNAKEKKCMIYEVRPFVCRDFKCDNKNWVKKRDLYEKRAKYNSTLTKGVMMATFDDKIYGDVMPIFRYLSPMFRYDENGKIDSRAIKYVLESVGRPELVKYMIGYDENNNKFEGEDIYKS